VFLTVPTSVPRAEYQGVARMGRRLRPARLRFGPPDFPLGPDSGGRYERILMKSQIVADGESRLRKSEGQQARLRELLESIRERHAAEWENAGFFQRLILRRQIAEEFRKERGTIEPSKYSLYGHKMAK
jgi:hypothetical protein